MKKIIYVLFLFLFLVILNDNVYASTFGVLGNVDKYNVLVNANKDGSIDMLYDISLDVTGDNVDKVKIIIPLGKPIVIDYDKKYISSIDFSYKTAIIYLKKVVQSNSKLNLKFKLNMKDVYTYIKKKDILNYRITIGRVKGFINNEIMVKWKKNGVYFQGMGIEEENYYIFKQNYSLLRKFDVVIQYKKDKFDIMQINNKFYLETTFYKYFLLSVGIFVIVFEIKKNVENRRYYSYSLRAKDIL